MSCAGNGPIKIAYSRKALTRININEWFAPTVLGIIPDGWHIIIHSHPAREKIREKKITGKTNEPDKHRPCSYVSDWGHQGRIQDFFQVRPKFPKCRKIYV